MKKQRETLQRRIVLEELRKLCTHPTAHELYVVLRTKLPRISLGTVYRNLEVLEGHNLVRRISVAGAEARFDGCIEKHYHSRCLGCGQIEDLDIKDLDLPIADLVKTSKFRIVDHNLELNGWCPECESHAKSAAVP